jgi:hypothetical protein
VVSQNHKNGTTVFWNVMLYSPVRRSHPTGSDLSPIITAFLDSEHFLVFRTEHSVSESKFASVLVVPTDVPASHRHFTSESRDQTQATPCGICSGQTGNGACSAPNSSVFHCHYHSTNAPLSSSNTGAIQA